MQGYDVITSEGDKVGHVTGTSGIYAIVENGLIRHSRHVVPLEFLNPVEGEEICRTPLSKDMIHDAPEADGDGNFDEQQVVVYYGIEQAGVKREGFDAAGDETPFVDTRPDATVPGGGGFEQERMVRGGL